MKPDPKTIWLSMAFDWWGAENAIFAQLHGRDIDGRPWILPADALSVLRYSLDLSTSALQRSTVRIRYEHAWFINHTLGSEEAIALAGRIESKTATLDDLDLITRLMERCLFYSNTNFEAPHQRRFPQPATQEPPPCS